MPRIGFNVPDALLQAASVRAQELGKSLDGLCVEAIERYIGATKHASPGAVRSRFVIPRGSPEIDVEVSEELFERADAAAKRQGKRWHVMCADALAYHLKASGPPPDSGLSRGHDLPSGAWRPVTPS